MKKFLASFIVLSSLVSPVFASISFSPLDMLQQESQNDSSLLASVLEDVNPEDFLTCEIVGNPDVVRGKANTFRVNAGIIFNAEMYYNNFISDVVNALDQLAEKSRKTSSYLVELNEKPAPFAPKFFSFNESNSQKVSELLSKFRTRAMRVKGLNIELQDSRGRTIHKIARPLSVQYLIFETAQGNNKPVWTLSPVIINLTEGKRTLDSKVILPVEFEIPSSILSSVSGMNASLYIEGYAEDEPQRVNVMSVKRQGWLGVSVVDVTRQKADSSGLPTTEGAMIKSVAQGSSADKAGLKRGDVVLMLNAERVTSGAAFAQKVGTFKEGDVLTMIINRDGKSYNARITLEARP